jgi:uncharacterized protein
MKESSYNFFINDNNKNIHLIYNSLNNTLVHDDDGKIQKFINQCSGNIQFNSDEIKEEVYNELISSGILVSDNISEKQIAIDTNKKRMETLHKKEDVLSLVITPTLQCNFRCYYCYESTKIRKNEDVLSKDVQNDIINFISKSIVENHIKEVSITWYGGEPLTQPQIIFSMQEKINTLCKLHEVKSYSSIVTNGILLTPEISKLLVEHGIKHAQVTIDGPEIIHNKRRFYPKEPTDNYRIILDNLLKANDNIRFSIRVNIDKGNKKFIYNLVDDLIKREIWPFKKNVSIYLAQVKSDNKKVDLSNEEYATFEDQVRYYLMEKYNEFTQTNNAKLRFHYPTTGGDVRCGYGINRNAWVISYTGDIFRCWQSVGCKEQIAGTMKDLLNDFGLSIFDKIKIDNQTFELWGCFECKYFPICSGNCPWDFLNSFSERRCTKWKSVLEYRLLNQYKQYLANPEIFTNLPFNTEEAINN